MKPPMILLALAIATAGLSCSGTTPPVSTGDTVTSQTPGEATANTVPQGVAKVSSLDGDVPPLGARFHLFCDDIAGPNHILRASQLKAQLAQATGLRGWHIIHAEQQSSLYFGYYRTVSKDDPRPDPQEVARAQSDLRRINELKNAQGDRLFRNPMFLPISEADPAAPAQWNLANAPADAYWSLQIGAYRGEAVAGTPDRKQCAVDDVRELRAAGIEAYYYHGETISSVCVGAWPREAIKEQDSDVARSARPDAPIFVVPDVLPSNVNPRMHDKEGNEVVVQAPKLEILDKDMAAMVRKFPNHAINGQVFGRKTANGSQIPDSSFLVLVPHAEGTSTPLAKDNVPVRNAASNSDAVDQAAANAITGGSTPSAPAAPTPGRGRLPSLDQP